MQGRLDYPGKKYITPKKVQPGQTSPDYSPAYPVEMSPIRDVKEAAEVGSRQEKFEKAMMKAANGKGRKTKRSRRRMTRRKR